jgi:hypothetical protein
MVKIAFGYKRRVGKDTSCDYLVQKYGGMKLSFAEPLYKILNFSQLTCNFKETKDRKFLQFVGTEWARSINENVWVDLLINKLKSYSEESESKTNIFVSDLRFKNEFRILKKHGFICVQVKNKKVEDCSDGYENHQSDYDLDNIIEWDYTINNIGSVEDLYVCLDQMFSQLV